MSLRTQGLLCFAAAALAVFGIRNASGYRFIVAAVAVAIGLSLLRDDKRRHREHAARLARIRAAATDDDDRGR